jgi:hypothetical protein
MSISMGIVSISSDFSEIGDLNGSFSISLFDKSVDSEIVV